MKKVILSLFILTLFSPLALAQTDDALSPAVLPAAPDAISTYRDVYLFNEIKDLRLKQEILKRELNQELNDRELRMSDRALGYVSNAVTYFSFFLTLSLGLFAVFGWRTIKDLKQSARVIVEEESRKLLDEFRGRLEVIETDLKHKGEEIIQNQKELEKVQHINALWMQANREKDDRKKLNALEQIRDMEPENEEVLVAKAASYLRLDLPEQALEACNEALEIAPDHPTAVYNRACAFAQLGRTEEALTSLHHAIRLSGHFKQSAKNDRDFTTLQKLKAFKELVA